HLYTLVNLAVAPSPNRRNPVRTALSRESFARSKFICDGLGPRTRWALFYGIATARFRFAPAPSARKCVAPPPMHRFLVALLVCIACLAPLRATESESL